MGVGVWAFSLLYFWGAARGPRWWWYVLVCVGVCVCVFSHFYLWKAVRDQYDNGMSLSAWVWACMILSLCVCNGLSGSNKDVDVPRASLFNSVAVKHVWTKSHTPTPTLTSTNHPHLGLKVQIGLKLNLIFHTLQNCIRCLKVQIGLKVNLIFHTLQNCLRCLGKTFFQ